MMYILKLTTFAVLVSAIFSARLYRDKRQLFPLFDESQVGPIEGGFPGFGFGSPDSNFGINQNRFAEFGPPSNIQRGSQNESPFIEDPFQNFPDDSQFRAVARQFSAPTTRQTNVGRSQTFLRCLGNCPSTMQYNPVCGSDQRTYHNEYRLMCANRCGDNVQIVRSGACSSSK